MTVAHVIEILAMGAACLIMFICKVKPAAVAKSGVFNGGVVGVMVCFGVAWMADTFFAAHKAEMVANFGAIVQAYPWLFGIALFAMTTLFSIITLPVEIDASHRALAWLRNSGITTYESQESAKDALKWAAYTYVIAALSSLATLLYYIMIYLGRRD